MSFTNFPNGATSFGIPLFGSGLECLGIGNVYFVVNAADAYTLAQARARYNDNVYEDGSKQLYIHDATSVAVTTNGIQNALNACKVNRNDYVVILPSSGSYYTDAVLAMNKETVHLIAPAGFGPPYGSTKAVRIAQITASTDLLTLSANYCEVAGLWLKNVASYSHIVLDAAQASNIHHNYMAVVWAGGANAPAIKGLTTGGAWGQIYRNWIISQAGNAATCAAVILIDASATSAMVNENVITIGDGNTATIGISNQAVKGMTNDNRFNESSSSGGYTGGTIAAAISISPTGGAIGNRGAVASGHMLAADGTTNVSYCQNFDGQAGGATAVTT